MDTAIKLSQNSVLLDVGQPSTAAINEIEDMNITDYQEPSPPSGSHFDDDSTIAADVDDNDDDNSNSTTNANGDAKKQVIFLLFLK